ncbi:1,6-anhydro-N-acetylmuramyl-L-alanine amidase AmpD [Oceanisphaera pacifica]|uniref:1,6-anhydro-N-acetylmuramyl-L-alanine amidase AmpD n=1 Tax=Oceanisphaera pacifica TaxID=2818389 RepID=A0ABS3NCP4_9GAMM|nr:1,6-anhydro-N-acetylmuramyl-L-alanine amidase AmpD [Oceanisphaera pacifica]MBO1518148.1 1,6-anhydro-N-acetylmuramyl-L-alanine amidase AmpD [Oceanisphaera pacifica]
MTHTPSLTLGDDHWLSPARHCPSPHYDERPGGEVSLLVVHSISLPPAQYGGPYIDQLFLGTLDPDEDAYFAQIHQLRVSAHCLIRRDGELVQYVPFNKRAWHAGQSNFNGRERCNDFAIGIELEGTDTDTFTKAQYQQLITVTRLLQARYPAITTQHIVGHSDIAPGRKTDPGSGFNWDFIDEV